MRKKSIFLLLFILLMPFLVKAATCDEDNISISSITLNDKTDSVTELGKPSASGRTINFNINMSDVGDNVEYGIVVKNHSDEDYELDTDNFAVLGEYIDYSMRTDDNSNIVKANSTKTVYLKVEYKKEVPAQMFKSGMVDVSQKLVVDLSSDIDQENPLTRASSYILVSGLALIGSGIALLILRKQKIAKYVTIIGGIAILIPMSVYAICKCQLSVESNIQITNDEFESGPYYNTETKKYYNELGKAMNKATNNQTIVVLEDVEEKNQAKIPTGLTGIVLDLNSHKVSFEKVKEEHPIINGSQLTIINNGDEQGEIDLFSSLLNNGSLTIQDDIYFRSENEAISNKGELNVKGGDILGYDARGILNSGTMNVTGGKINGYTSGIENKHELNVSAGEISGRTAISNSADATVNISDDAKIIATETGIGNAGTLNITGGEIRATYPYNVYGIRNNGTAELRNVNINVSATGEGSRSYGIDNNTGELKLHSGTINASIEDKGYEAIGIKNSSKLFIYDGQVIATTFRNTGLSATGIQTSGTSKTVITGGEIKGSLEGIEASGTYTLTLGTNDEEVSTSSPIIHGNSINGTGIALGSSGTFNFYDGIIKSSRGTEYCITGSENVINKPTNYIIYKEIVDDLHVAYLKTS